VVVVTGQLKDGTHVAFELVPSQGRTTPLAAGFLANETVQLLDAAHTLQTVTSSLTSPSYVLWVVVVAAAPPGTFDLVAIDLRSGETTQRLHLGGGGGVPATFPHTLAYDGASGTLVCTGLDTALTPALLHDRSGTAPQGVGAGAAAAGALRVERHVGVRPTPPRGLRAGRLERQREQAARGRQRRNQGGGEHHRHMRQRRPLHLPFQHRLLLSAGSGSRIAQGAEN